MQNKQKLLHLYDSGRFQCDLWFYQNLLILIKELQMYDYIGQLQKNLKHVKKITELIQTNSNSLDEQFDQEQAAERSLQIKKQIGLINSKDIQEIMIHCQKIKYTSYSHHIANLIKRYHYDPKYIQISSRIFNIHDPVLKIQNLLICCLFMLKNKQKVHQILKIYNTVLERGIQLLKQFKEDLKFIKENDSLKYNNKVLVYLGGIFAIYQILTIISELTKILQGKNNFTLKISAFKKDVEQIQTDTNFIQSGLKVKKLSNCIPVKSIKDLFIGDKNALDIVSHCCRICLRECDQNRQNHRLCEQILKELTKSKIN